MAKSEKPKAKSQWPNDSMLLLLLLILPIANCQLLF